MKGFKNDRYIYRYSIHRSTNEILQTGLNKNTYSTLNRCSTRQKNIGLRNT